MLSERFAVFIQEVVTISINGGQHLKIRVKESSGEIDTLFNFVNVESSCEEDDSEGEHNDLLWSSEFKYPLIHCPPQRTRLSAPQIEKQLQELDQDHPLLLLEVLLYYFQGLDHDNSKRNKKFATLKLIDGINGGTQKKKNRL